MLRPEPLGGTGLHLEKVGPALRRIRQERGLTQRDLAKRAGLTPALVSSYERGKRLPSSGPSPTSSPPCTPICGTWRGPLASGFWLQVGVGSESHFFPAGGSPRLL